MSVENDIQLLLNAGRTSPILRDAVLRIEREIRELRRMVDDVPILCNGCPVLRKWEEDEVSETYGSSPER